MRRFENPCYLITGVNALVEKTSKRVFLSEKQVSIKTSQHAIKTSKLQNIRHLGFQNSNFVQV